MILKTLFKPFAALVRAFDCITGIDECGNNGLLAVPSEKPAKSQTSPKELKTFRASDTFNPPMN